MPGTVRQALVWLRYDLPWELGHARDVWVDRLRRWWLVDNWWIGLWFTLTRCRYRTGNLSFVYPREKVGIAFRSRFLRDTYEQHERKMIARHIRSGARVLELGGCLGIVSCCINERCRGPGAKHVVVEANPALIPWLERNRLRNGADYTVVQGAVAAQPEVEFFFGTMIVGGSATARQGQAVKVRGITLADLQAAHGGFDTLVMDIEGGEAHVFLNETAALRSLRLIIVEMHPRILDADTVSLCRARLQQSGFRLLEVSDAVEVWMSDGAAS